VLTADRSLDLTCPGLGEPSNRLTRVSAGQCLTFYDDTPAVATRLVIEIPILGHLGIFFLGGGYLATSSAKSESDSCSPTPISYKGDEISRLCCVIFEI